MKKLASVFVSLLLIVSLVYLSACENDPEPENIPELITKATLTFSPVGGGSNVIVSATDPDGEGVQDIEVDGPINLLKGITYNLSVTLINGLYDPTDDEYDITAEVEEEGEEHQFFFSFSEAVFSSPIGTGNIKANASSAVGSINYLDEDTNNRPIGLSTSWTTINGTASSKTFRIILKHQPLVKSETSTSLDGETDLDLSFVINVN